MQGTTRATRIQPRTHRAHTRSLLSLAILGGLLAASPMLFAQDTMGQVGNADSWRSEEFKRDWGLEAINAHYAYARGLTGKGVRLGLFDSGTALAHPEFSGRNTTSIALSNDPECADPSVVVGVGACGATRGDRPGKSYYGLGPGVPPALAARLIAAGLPYGFVYEEHGTHVAGTIGANRDGTGTHGVAFGADLTAATVFGDTYNEWRLDPDGFYRPRPLYRTDPEDPATQSMFDQAQALGTRAINHSWGPTRRNTTEAQLEAYYAQQGAGYEVFASIYQPKDGKPASDLIQVWAAGNQAGGLASIAATLPRWHKEIEPYWLSVANVRLPGDGEEGYVIDESSSICGFSKDWCVSAPGTDIDSTIIAGRIDGRIDETDDYLRFLIDSEAPEYDYGLLTGTSMAAPHVTGALGLLFERFPYLSSAQVRDVLLTTATDIGAPGVDEIYGWGMLDLKKAIDGPGQLRVDTDVVMNQRAGGAKVWEGAAWDDWRNDIGGPGRLSKSGVGWLRLSGNNDFAGLTVQQGVLELTGNNAYAAEVTGGALIVNGSLSSDQTLAVRSGGILAGSGRIVGNARIEGVVSPGNSIGTLSVQGDYTQAAGSIYDAELSAGGQSDLISVSGKATLEGGTLVVHHAPGQYLLGQSFNLLSAGGGVSGQFAALDQTAFSPFLKFGLSYAANQVGVAVTRGASLASAAQTDNQRAAAAAADQLAIGQGIPQPLTQLFPAQAVAALDSLSGEGHASLRSIMVDDQRHIRDAALVRARAGRGAFAADAAGESSQGAWVELIKSGGTLDGDGNAARNEYNGSATLVGYDYRFDGGWRIGVLGGTGRSDSNDDRLDKGRVKSRHIGIYTGQNWGGFGLSAGFTFARQDVDLERRIGFNGFSDRTRASYDADSKQGFVEGGYRFNAGAWEFEPYAQFAQVRVSSDGFQETGGAAALTGRGADSRVNLSTVGLRFNVNLKGSQQDDSWLSLRGGLGRRHATGDLNPETSVAWRGANAFTVQGAPLADDATLLEAGIAARLSANGLLELNYSGQIADEAHDHGINARYSLRF